MEKPVQLKPAAVLYLEPHDGEGHDFAQCKVCKMFLADKGLCSLHGKDIKIGADDSCGFFVPGGPADESEMEHVSATVTPKESGLIRDTKVRCENCKYGGESNCGHSALGFPISPTGCCNAFESKGNGNGKTGYRPAPWLVK